MAFDPSQLSNLTLAWDPTTGVSVTGTNITSISGAYGTAVSLSATGSTNVVFESAIGPTGQNLTYWNATQKLSFTAETFTAWTMMAVVQSTTTSAFLVGHSTDNTSEYIDFPPVTTELFIRRLGHMVVTLPLPQALPKGLCIVTVTCDGAGNAQAWLNGVPGTAVNDPANLVGTMTFDQLGAAGSATGTLSGLMGPLMFYNRVLSATEISNLYFYLLPWLPTQYYVSAFLGADINLAPWNPRTPYQTINRAIAATSLPGTRISVRSGEIYREDFLVEGPNGTATQPIILSGSDWGSSSVSNGLSGRNKAEIRHSTAPALTLVSGTTYAAGPAVPVNSSFPGDYTHCLPHNYMYYIPGGFIQFGAQYVGGFAGVGTNPHALGPQAMVCLAIPKFSSNVVRMTLTSVQDILTVVNNGSGKLRMTMASTARYTTGHTVFVNSPTNNTGVQDTVTVVNGTTLDFINTAYNSVLVNLIGGSVIDLTIQNAPLVGEFGIDMLGVGGTVDQPYVNLGVALSVGDIEIPNQTIWQMRWDASYWQTSDIISCFATSLVFGAGHIWDHHENNFSTNDCFDLKANETGSLVTCTLSNSFVMYGGRNGNAYPSHPDPAGFGISAIAENWTFIHCAQTSFPLGTQSNILVIDRCLGVGEGLRFARQGDAAIPFVGSCTLTNSLIIVPNNMTGINSNDPMGAPYGVSHEGGPAPLTLINNTIVCLSPYAGSIGILMHDGVGLSGLTADPAAAVTAYNNIIYGFATGIDNLSSTIWTGDYNCVHGCTTPYSGVTAGAHDTSADPLFSSFPSGLDLLPASPVATSAFLAVSPSTDFTGSARRPQTAIGALDRLISFNIVVSTGSSTSFVKTMGIDYPLTPAGFASMVVAAKAAINGTTNTWTTILPPLIIDLSSATGNAITLTGMAPLNGGQFIMTGNRVNTILMFPQEQNGIFGVAVSNITLSNFQTRKSPSQLTICGTVAGLGVGYIDANIFSGYPAPNATFDVSILIGRYFRKFVTLGNGEPFGALSIFDYDGSDNIQIESGVPNGIPTVPTQNLDGSWRFFLTNPTQLVTTYSIGDIVGIKTKWASGDQIRFVTGSNITTSNITHNGSVREFYESITNLKIFNLTQANLPAINGQYPVLNSNEGGPQITSSTFSIDGYYARRLGDDPIAVFDTLGPCAGSIKNAVIYDAFSRNMFLSMLGSTSDVTVDSSCVLTRGDIIGPQNTIPTPNIFSLHDNSSAGFASALVAAEAYLTSQAGNLTAILQLPPGDIDLTGAPGIPINLTNFSPAGTGTLLIQGDPNGTTRILFPTVANGSGAQSYGFSGSNVTNLTLSNMKLTRGVNGVQTTATTYGTITSIPNSTTLVVTIPSGVPDLSAVYNAADNFGRSVRKYNSDFTLYDTPSNLQLGWNTPTNVGSRQWQITLSSAITTQDWAVNDTISLQSRFGHNSLVNIVGGSNITLTNITCQEFSNMLFENISNLTINGFTVARPSNRPLATNDGGPQCINCTNILLENFNVQNIGSDAITINSGCTGTVQQSTFTDCFASGILSNAGSNVTVASTAVMVRCYYEINGVVFSF